MGYSTDIKTVAQKMKTLISSITSFSTLFPGDVTRGGWKNLTNFPGIFIATNGSDATPVSGSETIDVLFFDVFVIFSTNVETDIPETVEDTQLDRIGSIIDKIENDRTILGSARNAEFVHWRANEDERISFPHIRIRFAVEIERNQ